MTETETFEVIRYTADIVLIASGHVLLIERGWDPFEGSWALPGGHVDAGETSLTAAARELAEETGITLPTAAFRQVGTFDTSGRDPRGRYVTVAYTATLPQTLPPAAGDDATAARWWPLNALPTLAFDHADILSAAVASTPETISTQTTAPVQPPWEHVQTITAWLDDCNGTDPEETALRILKISEEAGEAAQAYIGMRGQNPRKGVSHTRGDVAVELCDVILAATVALCSFDDDPAELLGMAARDRATRLQRAVPGLQDDDGQ